MIDLKELEAALKEMQPRQQLYELVKAEMKRRNRWKGKARGDDVKAVGDDEAAIGLR